MKGYIVVDIPESCGKCPVGKDIGDEYIKCPIKNMIQDVANKKPEWCPIKPLPEPYKEEKKCKMYMKNLETGETIAIGKIDAIKISKS